MKDSFDTLDYLFNLFTSDSELMSMLGNPITDEEKDVKVRREDVSPELLTDDMCPFISMYFEDSNITKNDLVNKGILKICYYTPYRYNAFQLAKRVRKLLKQNRNFDMIHEGQEASGVQSIYKYKEIWFPLVWG